MDQLTPIRSLPVATPGPTSKATEHGWREDGSFDFTQFFANFDLNSDVAQYLSEFDPTKFLSLLRLAASPPPRPPRATPTRFRLGKIEPSHTAMIDYQVKVDARNDAKAQLDKELAALDGVVSKMDETKVPGIEDLKKDFEAAKKFIFDAVANSNFQALDVHLEFEEPLRTPDVPTPDAPKLGPISLPPMTPLGTPGPVTPGGVETRWPSMLTDSNGLMYRIVATPRDLAYDAIGYFQSIVIPPTPNANASMDPAKEQKPSPVDRPSVPVFGRRPTGSWLRSLSGLGNTRPHQAVEP
ncbi:hypothetical protein CPB86DRAFT_114621 [Serendipita vermifera]|nr:hypothetical protein CPB86DRAFT_114621 [Serendipita vermifera]